MFHFSIFYFNKSCFNRAGWGLKATSGILFLLIASFAYSEGVIQPAGDERDFETLILENQLKVLLISDPETEKSAASMDVWVGSGDDPEDRQGLAHFLEHMLFLGTEKYPKAGEYQDFISGHGGGHNAYTSLEHTNYFFDIENQHFDIALDRFAQFFIAPLFDEKYVERERNAVHSEYRAKIKNDYRRTRDAFSEIVLDKHPLSHFSVGNLDTLAVDSPRPLRNDLITFYNAHYSADRMALVIVSNQKIEVLKKLVQSKFQAVKQHKLPDKLSFQKVFAPNALPARLSVRPVREERSINFSFPVPESREFYRSKPLGYIGFFIGHEGKGSLLSALKEANWATALSSGLNARWRGGEMFSVNISLTEKGVDHVPEIRALLFDYISLLKKRGISEWRFNEIAAVENARFNYGDKIDPIRQASYLASYLHEVPAKDLLQYNYLYQEYKPELFREFLSYLTRENLFETFTGPTAETDKVSQYYETPYGVRKLSDNDLQLSEEQIASLKSLKKSLSLPKKNKFIAKDFSIVGLSESSDKTLSPVKIGQGKQGEAWFVNDNTFDLPKGILSVRYQLPNIEKTAKYHVVAQIYCGILQEALNEVSYNANMAGLGYEMSATSRGIDLTFRGFDDSLDELVKVVFRTLDKYGNSKKYRNSVNQEHYNRIVTELIRHKKNFRHEVPFRQALRKIPDFMYSPFWSSEDVIAELEKMTLEEYDRLVKGMFDGAYASSFVFGNYSKKEGANLAKDLSSLLKGKQAAARTRGKVVKLVSSDAEYWHNFNVEHSDNVLGIYLQGDNDSIQERARVQLFSHILSAPFYTQLRTEQQLGYIVFGTSYPIKKVPGLLMLVQSPTHTSLQIKKEIDRFLNAADTNLFENFERKRSALAAKLREKAKSQSELRARLWDAILAEDYGFNDHLRLAETVEQLQVTDMKAFLAEIVSKSKAKFVIATNAEGAELTDGAEWIEDYLKFKKEKPFYDFP